MTREEMMRREQMEKQQRAAKIAESKASATPIQPVQTQAPQGGGGGGQNPLQQVGMQLGKKLLGSALGPLGGIIGGLFNEGGQVPMQGLNQGGWLSSLFGSGKPRTSFGVGQVTKAPRTQTTAQQRQQQRPAQSGGSWFSNPNRAKRDAAAQKTNFWGRNLGGPIPQGYNKGGPLANPHGYNEGGQMAQSAPLKRVMEEDKIEMAREAFERQEGRKDTKAAAEEQRASEAHKQAMTMKKAAATTNKAPLSKK